MSVVVATVLLLAVVGSVHAQYSDVMCMANRCPPTQIHTMLRPDGVSVSMLWQTFARTKGNSTVWLGTTSGKVGQNKRRNKYFYFFYCFSTNPHSCLS
jgi:hypothetical protein